MWGGMHGGGGRTCTAETAGIMARSVGLLYSDSSRANARVSVKNFIAYSAPFWMRRANCTKPWPPRRRLATPCSS